jgi:hypothetical protein
VVTERGSSEVLHKVNYKKLTTGENNNEFLLGTHNEERTVLLVAGEKGFLKSLQKVWFWAKKKLRNRRYN